MREPLPDSLGIRWAASSARELVWALKATDDGNQDSLATEERLNPLTRPCPAYFSEAMSITKR